MRVLIVILWASALLPGCGAMIEQSTVSRRFESTFSCPSAKVHGTYGGYRVEGCGVTAHYACFRSTRDPHQDHDHSRNGKAFAGALVEALVGAAFQVEDCVMEHSQRDAVASAGAEVDTPVFATRDASGPVIKTRMLIAGGRLELLGKPVLHPEHVLLSVHSQRRLPPSCSAELFNDGVPVAIERTERATEFEARVLLRVATLREVDRSIRFAGQVCGLEFTLDESARKALGNFEARFAETRARELAKSPVATAQP